MNAKRSITRVKGNEYVTVELEIRDRNGADEFSLCGIRGHVVTPKAARQEAIERYASYFEEGYNLRTYNAQAGTRFRSAERAARHALDTDGEYAGLDVTQETDGKVYIGHSFGQIREDIAEFFPDLRWAFKHHLNLMHAECEHQEARGETYQSHPSAVCPDCGYRLGSAWTSRPLPPEIYALVAADSAE